MDDKQEEGKDQTKRLLDIFEGVKGRRPQTDQELNEWLASTEGKAATMFEVADVSRWGETGRS
jgi:hypothetical protein